MTNKYLLPESVWCYDLTKFSTFREQRIQPCVLCPKRSGREDVYALTKNQIGFARSQELAELYPWQHEIITWFHRAKMGLCSHNPNICFKNVQIRWYYVVFYAAFLSMTATYYVAGSMSQGSGARRFISMGDRSSEGPDHVRAPLDSSPNSTTPLLEYVHWSKT